MEMQAIQSKPASMSSGCIVGKPDVMRLLPACPDIRAEHFTALEHPRSERRELNAAELGTMRREYQSA